MILKLDQLTIGYKKPLIENINEKVEKGEIIFLLGKNGIGKTTLFKTISKVIKPLKGNIYINGVHLEEIGINIGKNIAIVFSQTINHPHLTLYDLLCLGRFPYKNWYVGINKEEEKLVAEVIEILHLEEYKNSPIHTLSSGILQKAGIGRALVQDSPLLLLDEPFSHLDLSNQYLIINILKNLAFYKNKAIIFSSHSIDLGISLANRIWYINEDSLISGYTEDIAYSYHIYDTFIDSQNLIFDYKEGIFKNKESLKNEKSRKSVFIINKNREKEFHKDFWLKKALQRNDIQENNEEHSSEIKIDIQKEGFLVLLAHKTIFCKSIEELIQVIHS